MIKFESQNDEIKQKNEQKQKQKQKTKKQLLYCYS
jgi:hypothetical protein